jgi:SAM-dependent methyltransferase
MRFKDHFSKQSPNYSRYRPSYPTALFEYLAGLTAVKERAWDCATGNGQAALGLVPFYEEVIATDASEQQIANAIRHKNICYAVAIAEKTELQSSSIDLVVVAQAIHWFDLKRFYAEVKRLLKPQGAIAVWSYSLLRISPRVDRLLDEFYTDIVGPFWPPERKLVDDKYRSLPFPFRQLPAPHFNMEARWKLEHLIGYLGTWSSVQRYKQKYNDDPIGEIGGELRAAWGGQKRERRIIWPIYMRVGRV